jgi:hypothetical protein
MHPFLHLRVPAALAALLMSAAPAVWACSASVPVEIELRVMSDRGEGFDRLHRIRVHADGCVEFSAQVDAARLAPLRQRVADPVLRAIDPQRALADAQSALQARGRAEGELRRTHVSHPTGYVLRLASGGETIEIKAESIFQQAELHPQSRELALLAETIGEVLALDALPELRAEVSP